MDRNSIALASLTVSTVALRKESVDRNRYEHCEYIRGRESLSARRAWIEISSSLNDILAGVVALRKESVDRNSVLWGWPYVFGVALRKESVDRNIQVMGRLLVRLSRSPQGERG